MPTEQDVKQDTTPDLTERITSVSEPKAKPTFNTGETITLKGVTFRITNAIQGNTKKPGVLVLEEQKSS